MYTSTNSKLFALHYIIRGLDNWDKSLLFIFFLFFIFFFATVFIHTTHIIMKLSTHFSGHKIRVVSTLVHSWQFFYSIFNCRCSSDYLHRSSSDISMTCKLMNMCIRVKIYKRIQNIDLFAYFLQRLQADKNKDVRIYSSVSVLYIR